MPVSSTMLRYISMSGVNRRGFEGRGGTNQAIYKLAPRASNHCCATTLALALDPTKCERQHTNCHKREKRTRVIDNQEPEVFFSLALTLTPTLTPYPGKRETGNGKRTDPHNPPPPLRKLKVRRYQPNNLNHRGGNGHEHHGPLDASTVGAAKGEDEDHFH
jgi:hypothetical protein